MDAEYNALIMKLTGVEAAKIASMAGIADQDEAGDYVVASDAEYTAVLTAMIQFIKVKK